MHRHGVSQRKLSRQRDQRNLLIRGQVTSLILHEAIITTEAKAKTVAPVFERLVTKAKQNDLAGSRAIRRVVTSDNAARKLQVELAPVWADRQGGYTRIVKLPPRMGDNAKMAQLSLVLPTQTPVKATEPAVASKTATKPAATPKAVKKAPAKPKATTKAAKESK